MQTKRNAARVAAREAERKKRTQRNILLYGGLGIALVAVAVIVYLVVSQQQSTSGGPIGEEIAIPSRNHVADSAEPGPYLSNPPAGGAHYSTDYTEKFYQESDLPGLPAHPEGYLVHSLEHGYVIFWYNCQAANTDCAALKQSIQTVMDQTGKEKLIAFPWSKMDMPLAMTSWGRLLKFKTPDEKLMKQFVLRNRYQAPEPDAP
jgi:hypothetical protein